MCVAEWQYLGMVGEKLSLLTLTWSHGEPIAQNARVELAVRNSPL
jgi:hypothetical protein